MQFNANKEDSIWNSLAPIDIDKEKLACLFELKQAEVKTKVRDYYLFFEFFVWISFQE